MMDEDVREVLARHIQQFEHVAPPELATIRRRARRRAIRALSSALAAAVVLGTVAGVTGWAASRPHLATAGPRPSTQPQAGQSLPHSSPPPASRSQAEPCTPRSLRLSPVRKTASTMPGIITAVRFRNTGTTTCFVQGWPTVKVPPRHPGGPLVVVKYFLATGSWSVKVTKVMLRPGESAAASMMIGNAARFGACGSRDWAITPPGSKHAVIVPEPKTWPTACLLTGLAVSPYYPARYAPLTGNYPR